MKRPLLILFGLLVVGAVLASAYVLFTPKIGTATRAQIDAALPASLKVQDPPDPQAEARYARLAALLRGLKDREIEGAARPSTVALGAPPGAAPGAPNPFTKAGTPSVAAVLAQGRPALDGVEALLREGPIRYPRREIETRFDDVSKLKAFAKLLRLAMIDAAKRGDRAGCARYAALGLRYGRASLDGGGVIIDSLVAVATDAIAVRAVYEAEMAGGLGARGREAVLSQLPVEKGTLPELGSAVRRDFQAMFLPVLVDPKRFLTPEMVGTIGPDGEFRKPERGYGTFDPVATSKLAGAIYDAGIAEAMRGSGPQIGQAMRLANAAGEGVPQTSDTGGPGGFWYRLRMNMGRNTLGRQFASQAIVFDGLASAGLRRAANRNLLRAVLLLRSDRPVVISDPYGTGNLRVDAKRRIVWSVGENGKDDGGDIGTRLGDRAPDLGYRY